MNIGTYVPSKRANTYKCQAIVSLLKSGLYSTAWEKSQKFIFECQVSIQCSYLIQIVEQYTHQTKHISEDCQQSVLTVCIDHLLK